MVRRMSPLLDQVLGIFIPLIATNCAVLGVALLNVQQAKGFVQSVFFGLGAAMGFALVLVLFGAHPGTPWTPPTYRLPFRRYRNCPE